MKDEEIPFIVRTKSGKMHTVLDGRMEVIGAACVFFSQGKMELLIPLDEIASVDRDHAYALEQIAARTKPTPAP